MSAAASDRFAPIFGALKFRGTVVHRTPSAVARHLKLIIFDKTDAKVSYDWALALQQDVFGLEVKLIDRRRMCVGVCDSRNDPLKDSKPLAGTSNFGWSPKEPPAQYCV